MILKPCQADAKCIATERQALVAFKQGLTDPSGRLSSWEGEDCCKWDGISYNNRTGYVIKLDFRNPFKLTYGRVADSEARKKPCLGGEINPSFVSLE